MYHSRRYLRQSKTGRNVAPLVFLKAAGCIMWGSADLLNVAFAGGDDRRMGWIFAAVGVGCLLGPNVSDALVKRKASDGAIPLKTLLRLCVIGMGLVTFGVSQGRCTRSGWSCFNATSAPLA